METKREKRLQESAKKQGAQGTSNVKAPSQGEDKRAKEFVMHALLGCRPCKRATVHEGGCMRSGLLRVVRCDTATGVHS